MNILLNLIFLTGFNRKCIFLTVSKTAYFAYRKGQTIRAGSDILAVCLSLLCSDHHFHKALPCMKPMTRIYPQCIPENSNSSHNKTKVTIIMLFLSCSIIFKFMSAFDDEDIIQSILMSVSY